MTFGSEIDISILKIEISIMKILFEFKKKSLNLEIDI